MPSGPAETTAMALPAWSISSVAFFGGGKGVPGCSALHTLTATAHTTLQPPKGCSPTTTTPPRLVTELQQPVRPTPAISCLRLGISGTVCAGFSQFFLLSGCCFLPQASEALFLSLLTSLLERGHPSVRALFLLCCSFPTGQVLHQFPFSFFLLLIFVRNLLVFQSKRYSAKVQEVFCVN